MALKGVFSPKESLEALNFLESLENGRILLDFSESGGSLKSLESTQKTLESLEMDFSEKTPIPKDPFFRTLSKRPLFPNPSITEGFKHPCLHSVNAVSRKYCLDTLLAQGQITG